MDLTDHDIRTLLDGSVRGDRKSSKDLYEHLVDKVYPFVRYRTATLEHATDITQDVFIDFFSTLSNFTYHTVAQLYAYVFVITRRKLARYYNEAEKHGGVSGLIEFNEDTMSEASTETPADLRLDVAQALDTLEETTREILVLHHFSRYTFGEIALLLDMTESAVRVRHHRAVQTLAEHLTE